MLESNTYKTVEILSSGIEVKIKQTKNSIGEEQPLLGTLLENEKEGKESIEKNISSATCNEIRNVGTNVKETALNIGKTCIGTGTLALPYACSEGGLLFSVIGLILLSLWNYNAVHRLIKCAELIQIYEQDLNNGKYEEIDVEEDGEIKHNNNLRFGEKSPSGTSTFGKVAWYSFGSAGLYSFDCTMILFFNWNCNFL